MVFQSRRPALFEQPPEQAGAIAVAGHRQGHRATRGPDLAHGLDQDVVALGRADVAQGTDEQGVFAQAQAGAQRQRRHIVGRGIDAVVHDGAAALAQAEPRDQSLTQGVGDKRDRAAAGVDHAGLEAGLVVIGADIDLAVEGSDQSAAGQARGHAGIDARAEQVRVDHVDAIAPNEADQRCQVAGAPGGVLPRDQIDVQPERAHRIVDPARADEGHMAVVARVGRAPRQLHHHGLGPARSRRIDRVQDVHGPGRSRVPGRRSFR